MWTKLRNSESGSTRSKSSRSARTKGFLHFLSLPNFLTAWRESTRIRSYVSSPRGGGGGFHRRMGNDKNQPETYLKGVGP